MKVSLETAVGLQTTPAVVLLRTGEVPGSDLGPDTDYSHRFMFRVVAH